MVLYVYACELLFVGGRCLDLVELLVGCMGMVVLIKQIHRYCCVSMWHIKNRKISDLVYKEGMDVLGGVVEARNATVWCVCARNCDLRQLRELAHVSFIARGFKTCADELSL